MNREAFKKRMQNLKSYREQNPDKTYIEFMSYQNGGETDDTVSANYVKRYPNTIKKVGNLDSASNRALAQERGYTNPLESDLSRFSKNDSAVYTPALDRIEEYLKDNSFTTSRELINAKNAAIMLATELSFGANQKNKNHEMINSYISKLTDADIKKIINTDLQHVNLKSAANIIPKKLNLFDIFKLGKYFSSDEAKQDYFGISKASKFIGEGGTGDVNDVIQSINVGAYEDGGSIDDRTDHSISRPDIIEPIERTVNGKKWHELSPKEQFMNRRGYQSGRPTEEGLEIVSPEFDVITGLRSIATLPKKFLGKPGIPKNEDYFYRQVKRQSRGIERAKTIGIIDVKSSAKKAIDIGNGNTINLGKTFDVPFFKKGDLWYGNNKSMDVIINKGNDKLQWMPITKSGGFRPNAINDPSASNRVTPLVDGAANQAPSNMFEFYRNYPGLGFRNITEGTPHIPVTGINTISENINQYADGGQTPTEPIDPPYPNIVNGRRVNPYTGQPIATGQANAVFDIEDAANMTPVGDALTIKDIGKQAVDKDWAGAGISALGLLPIVGGSLYKSVIKKAAKSGVTQVGKNIPKVNKNATQDAINAFEKARTIPNEVLEKFTDERNRTLELLNTKKAMVRLLKKRN